MQLFHKTLFALAALVLSTAALIFALRYTAAPAGAVAIHQRARTAGDLIYTQSRDGMTLFEWRYHKKSHSWRRTSHVHADSTTTKGVRSKKLYNAHDF